MEGRESVADNSGHEELSRLNSAQRECLRQLQMMRKGLAIEGLAGSRGDQYIKQDIHALTQGLQPSEECRLGQSGTGWAAIEEEREFVPVVQNVEKCHSAGDSQQSP